MVDYLSLAVSHAVLLLAFWRLAHRDDLDTDPPDDPDQQAGTGSGNSRGA